MQCVFLVLVLLASIISGHHHHHGHKKWSHNDDFMMTDFLGDGEYEMQLKYGKIMAKETAFFKGQDESTGLVLWQVSDQRHFIQLIYSEGRLKDCEYLKEKHVVQKFITEFRDGADRARMLVERPGGDVRNVTYRTLPSNETLTADLRRVTDYRGLRQECKEHHKTMKRLAHQKQHGDPATQRAAQEEIDRVKRDIMDVFRIPGTSWCGRGNVALKHEQLGPFAGADKCCRYHDMGCPLYIRAFEKKYSLYNWRVYTLMHCACDERFRSCLKMTNTGAANMVGKIFFNVIQTKCFILKPEKVCSKRSWWGRCNKYEKKMQAYLRDSMNY